VEGGRGYSGKAIVLPGLARGRGLMWEQSRNTATRDHHEALKELNDLLDGTTSDRKHVS
jgi:hypothetical protein